MKHLTLWGIYMPIAFIAAGPVGMAILYIVHKLYKYSKK